MFRKRNTRINNEINGGSLADIGFLLLIFFLVSTTIFKEKGIKHVLPPYSETQGSGKTTSKILTILINAEGEVLLNTKQISLDQMYNELLDFIDNPKQNPAFPKEPKNAAIVFKHHETIPYQSYTKTYATIHKAYKDLRNQWAQKKLNKRYEALSNSEKRIIKELVPLNISEMTVSTI